MQHERVQLKHSTNQHFSSGTAEQQWHGGGCVEMPKPEPALRLPALRLVQSMTASAPRLPTDVLHAIYAAAGPLRSACGTGAVPA